MGIQASPPDDVSDADPGFNASFGVMGIQALINVARYLLERAVSMPHSA